MGILPKGYTLSSLEALKKEGSLNVQAGTAFVDLEFLEEVGCFLQSDYFLLSLFFFMSHWLLLLPLIVITFHVIQVNARKLSATVCHRLPYITAYKHIAFDVALENIEFLFIF